MHSNLNDPWQTSLFDYFSKLTVIGIIKILTLIINKTQVSRFAPTFRKVKMFLDIDIN